MVRAGYLACRTSADAPDGSLDLSGATKITLGGDPSRPIFRDRGRIALDFLRADRAVFFD